MQLKKSCSVQPDQGQQRAALSVNTELTLTDSDVGRMIAERQPWTPNGVATRTAWNQCSGATNPVRIPLVLLICDGFDFPQKKT